jgi:tetratricopeptide (TPR) repeat protein
LGELYIYSHEYDKALEQLDNTIELDPNFRAAIHTKAFAYLWLGEYDKAIEIFSEYRKKIGDPLKGVTGIGAAYAYMGNIEKAKDYLAILDQRVKRDKGITLNSDYLLIYNALGDFDKAFEHLEDGIKKEESIFFVRINPFFEKLREDKRYHQLLNKYFNQ